VCRARPPPACTWSILERVYERTALKVREHFAHVPEELRLKKLELGRAEGRVRSFVEFVAQGRAPRAIADAFEVEEDKVKSLQRDVASLEVARAETFEPPPRGWIADRVGDLQRVLEQRTEKSGLILRRLLGDVTLTPNWPEVGRPYLQARSSFEALNLIEDRELNLEPDRGSNLLQWWRRRESNLPYRSPVDGVWAEEMRWIAFSPFVARDLGSGRRGPQEDPDGRAACDGRATLTGEPLARWAWYDRACPPSRCPSSPSLKSTSTTKTTRSRQHSTTRRSWRLRPPCFKPWLRSRTPTALVLSRHMMRSCGDCESTTVASEAVEPCLVSAGGGRPSEHPLGHGR
jgi:hypothetical protein